jgi:hypothetical protein
MGRVVRLIFRSLSFIVALIAIGIGYLKLDDVNRQKSAFKFLIYYFHRIYSVSYFLVFAKVLNKMSDPNDANIMNLRCNQILKHSDVKSRILEIGAVTGINFPCLYNNTNIESYIGIEPNIHMHQYFNDAIKKWQIPYEIRLSIQLL